MSGKTKISWAEKTWNPTLGCQLAGAGCTNCYAMWVGAKIAQGDGAIARAYASVIKHVNGKPVWNGKTVVMPDEILEAPLRWQKPAIVFVDSMADLFYEELATADIERVLDVMARAPHHLFLVLTKRPTRMRALVEAWMAKRGIAGPLDNIGLGASAWNQASLESAGAEVSRMPTRVRFLSAEPMLGPMRLNAVAPVDQIICGGESISPEQRAMGETARPFDLAWARDLRDDCAARGIMFHFKQCGQNPVGFVPSDPKGGAEADIPADLRVREMPDLPAPRQAALL
mgnify:FL=1